MSRPSRTEQREATREKLLRVARRVFTRNGYAATSIAGISKAARVTHGALYHHFPSKIEIFQAVLDALVDEVGGRVREAVADKTGWDGVEAACFAYLDACMDESVQVILLRDGPSVLADAPRKTHAPFNEPLISGLLERWIADGVVRDLPIVVARRILGGAFAEAGALLANSEQPRKTRAEIERFLTLLLSGLRNE